MGQKKISNLHIVTDIKSLFSKSSDVIMAAEAQNRVQHAVESMLENIERERLRPLLRKTHLDCAKCYENKSATKEQVERCMQTSFQPAQNVQQAISNELSSFQQRISRCANQCQDEAQDQVSGTSSPQDVAQAQTQLDGCVSNCCDKHIQLIPKMMSRINDVPQQAGSRLFVEASPTE